MTEAHAERAHATLAPSAAKQWMSCPGSIRMSEGIKQTSSVFAREGTAAHELATKCLNGLSGAGAYLGQAIDMRNATVVSGGCADEDYVFAINEEMVSAVDEYLDAIDTARKEMGDDVEMLVEQRLDMSHIHPSIWGTGDCSLYGPKSKKLHVFDLKYGKGVLVSPEENPQALLYASGVVKRLHNRGIKEIELTISQPRAQGESTKTWKIDAIWLLEWEATVAEAAYATDADDAPLHAGEWCKFCPAAGTCPELHDSAMRAAEIEFADPDPQVPDARKYDPAALAVKLSHVPLLKEFIKRIEEFAHSEAMQGRPPPGFKLVAGRSTRKWDITVDPDQLMQLCDLMGVEPYAEPALKSPAQLEKLLPKDKRPMLVPYIVKKSSGSLLVSESDPREPLKIVTAEEEFGAVEST